MFMLRSTHERIVNEKNIAALNYVDQQKRIMGKLQATIEERNIEIAELRRRLAELSVDLSAAMMSKSRRKTT